MSVYVLIVMINTMYNSSIDFYEFNSQQSCEDAATKIRAKIKDGEIICQKK